GEVPARNEPDAHGFEELWTDREVVGVSFLERRRARQVEARGPKASAEQRHLRIADREYSRHGGEALLQVAVQRGEPGALVSGESGVQAEIQNVFSGEARINALQVLQRVNQQ